MTTKIKSAIFIIAVVVVLLVVFFLWRSGVLNNYLPFFLTTDGWNKQEREFNHPNNGANENNNSNTFALTKAEAQAIAENTCIKGGDALIGSGTYNPNSKTWWFDANLNATREGCNPACVVSEETKTAEINWRCTGLILPDESSPEMPEASDKCGIENCHGLDIVCGPNPAEMCDMMYQLGDKCRQFAECGMVAGVCQEIVNPEFTDCKSCVEKCEQDFSNDPQKAFECESECG